MHRGWWSLAFSFVYNADVETTSLTPVAIRLAINATYRVIYSRTDAALVRRWRWVFALSLVCNLDFNACRLTFVRVSHTVHATDRVVCGQARAGCTCCRILSNGAHGTQAYERYQLRGKH